MVLGLLAAVLLRGVLTPATDKGWFGYIKPIDGAWNKATLPLQVALAFGQQLTLQSWLTSNAWRHGHSSNLV